MTDVTIIGGGTAGLFLAQELKGKGISSVVYEEHKELGKPVHDTGILSKNLDEYIDVHKKITLNKVRGARLHSPTGKVVELSRTEDQAYILDRDKLEKQLAKGIDVRMGERISKLNFKSKYIVGADGSRSTVATLAGFPEINNYLMGLQYEVENTGAYDKDFVELYFGREFAPGFFSWIVPTNGRLRIGLAVNGNAKEYLDKFVKAKLGKTEILETIGGLIPMRWRSQFVKGNIALVGDAAGQVKPTTGGGIYMGMASSRILANAIVKNDLAFYEAEWYEKIMPELEHGFKIRNFLNMLSDREIDKIFDLLQNEKIRKLILEHGDMDKPAKLVKAVLGNPELLVGYLPYLRYLW